MDTIKVKRCDNCGVKVKKFYRINVSFRDPTKKYVNSKLVFIPTINRAYCKGCFGYSARKIKLELNG